MCLKYLLTKQKANKSEGTRSFRRKAPLCENIQKMSSPNLTLKMSISVKVKSNSQLPFKFEDEKRVTSSPQRIKGEGEKNNITPRRISTKNVKQVKHKTSLVPNSHQSSSHGDKCPKTSPLVLASENDTSLHDPIKPKSEVLSAYEILETKPFKGDCVETNPIEEQSAIDKIVAVILSFKLFVLLLNSLNMFF